MRYADPSLCPDCRGDLAAGVPVCPACGLLVRHPIAVELFRSLRRADALLTDLRTASTTFHQDRPVPATTASVPRPSSLGGPLVPPAGPVPAKRATLPAPGASGGLPVYPAPTPAPAAAPLPAPVVRTGVSLASVPKILLGLGAFCLLVAALIFLAVSWSTLGVGGRTAVLLGLTTAAGGAALALHRAGLRVAGESLAVVALGMLALDVVGAGAAGWLGTGRDEVVAAATGLTVAAAAVGLGLLRVAGRARLVAPQVIAGIGLLVGYLGAVGATGHHLVVGHLVTGLVVAVVVLARRADAPALTWSAAGAGTLAWLGTAGAAATDALVDPTLRHLWVDGSGWSLLTSAAALLLPGTIVRDRSLLTAGAGGAALVVTAVLTLPSVDSGETVFGTVALAATAAWVLAYALLPRAVRVAALAPAAAGSVILVGLAATTAAVAGARWQHLGAPFTHDADVALRTPEAITQPLLVVPSLLVATALAALLHPAPSRRTSASAGRAAVVIGGLGAATTLASYDVALALPLAVVAATAIAAAAWAFTTAGAESVAFAWTCAGVAGVAVLAALPSDILTLAAAGVATVLTVALAAVPGSRTRQVAGAPSAAFLAIATTAAVHLAGGDAAWTAVPVLIATGVLALALPRVELEVVAALAALLALPLSLEAAQDTGGVGALWLTVAGCLACATALLHRHRRWAAPVGAGLLVVASWVRLADLHVQQPEPYTLPLAAALLAVGLWRMQGSREIGTAEALLPGLAVATAPSLIWVLGDPLSLRALLLGAACLALAVAGAALRWSAPLLVGASVGAAIVLRELGPYAGEFPKWVWIGLAGALLTVVGITWERRLLEVRDAVGLLGRLR